ncbi:hypothetical protein AAG570_011249 [Ranatra chinensis]|uniref:Tyrosinase copper-binding domain-containing protein n=1 Tax=Ranatra chinensis TaxID=642074 RepID=A0ABD0YK34_9HEMI
MGAPSEKAKILLNMFDRPTEPVFMPKGDNNSVFDVPSEYLVDEYRPLENDLSNRFSGVEKIPVKKISIPDLNIPLSLGRRENFSLFIPRHNRIAARLISIFMGMRSLDDFISLATYCRDRLNPYLFVYALSVAILHRPDTKNLPIPTLNEVFPEKYMDGAIFAQAKETSNIVPSNQRVPLVIPVDYTATDLELEHRIAYWREDLGINLHHWHWHLVYPFNADRNIVDKDRRGELFFYMHQQIMARYNFERFCNNLARCKRLLNWREPVEEGYFPKLDSLVSSRVWPPRFDNTKLSDINREVDQITFDIQDLERWRDRIFSAIHSGSVIDSSGNTIQLTESRGIDILGNILEASILTINRNLYGDLHNLGHVALALAHDPDHKHLETFGVIADPATAMRDPAFYRLHAFVDDIFQEHKNTLPRYTVQQLDFTGVRVTGFEVINDGGRKNVFQTFWQQSDVELSRGMDFTPRGSLLARFTHLQHTPFSYKIQVTNSGAARQGTVRIFLAPATDERGLPMLFRDQKNMFVELDKFTVNLRPSNNVIDRKSTDSSLTIPFERTFRNIGSDRPAEGSAGLEAFNFCGCGWPQHMLLPKGATGGFPCQLFIMVSDFKDDRVDQPDPSSKPCADAASFCGIRDSLYPDKRSMGYPFDRLPRDGVDTLNQFLTPNMRVQDINIEFTNRTVRPRTPGMNSDTV